MTRDGSVRRRAGARRPASFAVVVSVALVALAGVAAATVLAAPAPALALARPRLAARVSSALRLSKVGLRTTGILIKAVGEGGSVVSRAPGRAFMPASNMKLVTSCMAFDRLGPSYRWRTTLSVESTPTTSGVVGSIYLAGHGDPMLSTRARARKLHVPGTSYLDGLADALRSKGVTYVAGNLIVDESFFDSRRAGGRWKSSYASYCAPLSALSIDRNYSAKGGWEKSPALAAGLRLAAMLKARRIKLKGRVIAAREPAGLYLIGTVKSRRLREAIAYMDLTSDNFTAEMIAKTVAAETYGRGTSARAALLAASEVTRSGGSLKQFRAYDGSGLSRYDRASPAVLVKLLGYAEGRPWASYLRAALPVAGKSGTLAGRMRGTAAAGRVRAKTGTLSDVSTLSGFATSRGGTRFVFSMMTNGASPTDAQVTQDAVCAVLAAYTGR
jgi:serine-type D-Ala-D-Ala carboxypeptidase/endopeptidase (penicillin-binding protein 4)